MDLRDKAVTIVGMGRSALAAARLLRHVGARPFVTDAGAAEALAEQTRALDDLCVPYETGGHSAAAFDEACLLVMSPGVPAGIPPVRAAATRGIPVWAEIELAARYSTARILAVSGTNGKTTTTELLRAMISACGHRVGLAGNNDTAFSDTVLLDPQPDYMVLEVSSYQLETTVSLRPWIAGILNLTPDHLGRHGDMQGYAAAKARLFQCQTAGDVAVLPADDPWVSAMQPPAGVRVLRFSLDHPLDDGLWFDGDTVRDGTAVLARLDDIPLPGKHNLENVLAALAMMRAAGFAWDGVLQGLRAFQGVEHRIEHVTRLAGIDVYNDSKSTNVDSLRVALDSFARPIVLIAGGVGKGADYGVLADRIRNHVKHLITIGDDAPKLEAAFGGLVPTGRAGSMEDAVRSAYAAAAGGDVILLSPGCASFDWYRNFEERGRDFKQWARALAPAPSVVEGR
jgi:UDP-N-acetylmuramoylalanine--D-glutamate ligase